jgi:hypothetical protein
MRLRPALRAGRVEMTASVSALSIFLHPPLTLH